MLMSSSDFDGPRGPAGTDNADRPEDAFGLPPVLLRYWQAIARIRVMRPTTG